MMKKRVVGIPSTLPRPVWALTQLPVEEESHESQSSSCSDLASDVETD